MASNNATQARWALFFLSFFCFFFCFFLFSFLAANKCATHTHAHLALTSTRKLRLAFGRAAISDQCRGLAATVRDLGFSQGSLSEAAWYWLY